VGKPASKPVAHSRFSSGTMRPVRGLPSETCLNQTALLLRFTGISSHTSNTFQVAPPLRPPLRGLGLEPELAFSASPSHQNPCVPLPTALRVWFYVSPLARPLGRKGGCLPSALGARPQSLRHPLPYAGCGICATDVRLSSLTSRDSEGGFVREDGSFALRD